MPRGVYVRKSKKNAGMDINSLVGMVNVNKRIETDAEVEARIGERFEVLEELCSAVTDGTARSLIVSGPAGLGKSFSVEKILNEWDPSEINHTFVRGFVRATGLYKLLHQYRNKGQVIVFDDADAVFFDDVALNLLKAVCDTTERRRVSWLSETNMVDDDADRLPRHFEFNGSIVFITNLDFDALIDRGHKLAPHLQALVSRSHYIDLSMKTKQDYLVRIRQVIKQGLLKHLNFVEQTDVLLFIKQNSETLRELSLRMALKLASIRKSKSTGWEKTARITCCRSR